MLTWEGKSPTQMLMLQTALVDEDQAAVPQLHISLVTEHSRAVVLVNWASWPDFAKHKSDGVLVALLPGDRRFDIGKAVAQLEETIVPDSKLSSPTPIEILVETDDRLSQATDAKAALTSFINECLGTAAGTRLASTPPLLRMIPTFRLLQGSKPLPRTSKRPWPLVALPAPSQE
eukprot:6458997-Amphidinium_carterae.1